MGIGGCRGGGVLTVLSFGYVYCQEHTGTGLQHDPAVVALVAGFTGNSRYVGTALSFLSAVLMSYFRCIPQSFRTNAGAFFRLGHDHFLLDRLHIIVPIFWWFVFIVTSSSVTELPLLVEGYRLLNDIFPFPSILDAGYPIFNLLMANVLFDIILPSVLGSSLWSFG